MNLCVPYMCLHPRGGVNNTHEVYILVLHGDVLEAAIEMSKVTLPNHEHVAR